MDVNEMAHLTELLRKASDVGALQKAMEQAIIAPKAKVKAKAYPCASGSMTDASKRLRGDSDAADIIEDMPPGMEVPIPFPTDPDSKWEWIAAMKKAESKIELPKGVSSLARWGETLITMNAMKDRNISCAEAVNQAGADDKIASYLGFILSKYGDQQDVNSTTAAGDLAMYLKAVCFEPTSKSSGFVRKYKA